MTRDRRFHKAKSRPFWLPASTYYFLAVGVAVGVFFLVWGILSGTEDETPWITAGLMSSVSMICAVVIREVIVRTRRDRVFEAQRKLDRVLMSPSIPVKQVSDSDRLTLERNAIFLDDINRKSEAANVLFKLAESHREVFELCERYMELAARELPNVSIGSPRLAAISRGRNKAERLHRQHMLKWAEIEVRSNTEGLSEAERANVRLGKAKRALDAVNTALSHYPEEKRVKESKDIIEKFVLSIEITDALQRAERAEARGNFEGALKAFREAERAIGASGDGLDGAEKIRARLRDDIERLERHNR